MGRDGRGVKPGSDSSIEISFMYQGIRCRERITLKPTATNLKRAELHRAAILDAILRGTFDYATTFPNSSRATQFSSTKPESTKAYLERWLDRKEVEVKASTAEGYRKIITHRVIPQFGDLPLSELSRKRIREWLDGLTTSNKTLSNIQSCLRSALDDAVYDERIESNPLQGWTYQRREAPKQTDDVDPFTAEEQQAIQAQLNGQGRNLIQFAFWTGLRTSELVALDWGDIDWIRGVVRISRALTQAATEAETTKTTSGQREVKLLKPALQALMDQKQHTFLAGLEVFQNPRTGERWAGDGPIRKTLWQPALKRAGVRYRRPYQTRHTYASMMLSAGEHPMWVATQMGHSSWMMISRIYGRWMPSADVGAGSKAESLFGNNDNTMTTSRLKGA